MKRRKGMPAVMNMMDKEFWNEIDPKESQTRFSKVQSKDLPTSKEEESKTECFEETETTKDKETNEKGIPLKNNIFTLASLLTQLFIKNENPNYQLFYCMCALKGSLKLLGTTIRKDGFAQLYMVGMKSKVDWDEMKRNSRPFSEVISEFLIKSGSVCMVATKNRKENRKIADSYAPYIVLLTPTDIPTPCKGNLCVGTGWVIYRRRHRSLQLLTDKEIYNCGRRAVNGGISINGCMSFLITAFKKHPGLQHFIFDPRIGEFIMHDTSMTMPSKGKGLSLNEGLFYGFNKEFQDWLAKKKDSKFPNEEYYSRYTGGWLTDAYKILTVGGILISPRDLQQPEGRVSLLFEALPLAFLAEKAGGKATDGQIPIMKLKVNNQNKLTNIVLGSTENVNEVTLLASEIIKDVPRPKVHDNLSDDTSTDYE